MLVSTLVFVAHDIRTQLPITRWLNVLSVCQGLVMSTKYFGYNCGPTLQRQRQTGSEIRQHPHITTFWLLGIRTHGRPHALYYPGGWMCFIWTPFSHDMKHANIARWLPIPNHGRSHLPHNLWSSYKYLILYQSDDLVSIKWSFRILENVDYLT